MSTLSNNLRRYRQAEGLTQIQLAEKIGVSPQAIASWENGRRVPRLKYLEKLSKALHANIATLNDSRTSLVIRDFPELREPKIEVKQPPIKEEKFEDQLIHRLDRIIELLENVDISRKEER